MRVSREQRGMDKYWELKGTPVLNKAGVYVFYLGEILSKTHKIVTIIIIVKWKIICYNIKKEVFYKEVLL